MAEPAKKIEPAPAAAPVEDKKPDIPVRVQAHSKSVKRGGELFTTWECIAEEQHSLEDVCTPWYLWRRTSMGDMKAGDEIIIHHPSHAYRVHLYLIGIDPTAQALMLKLLSVTDLTDIIPISANLDGCVILGEADNWYVQQGSIRIKAGFKNREEARGWLARESERRIKMFINK